MINGKQIITKLISGSKFRKSRLHDMRGNFAGWNNIYRHLLPAFSLGIVRLAINYHPELPWISYSAIKYIDSYLTTKSRVLEYGSGFSTIWLSKHSGEVFSIEDDRNWYNKISYIIQNQALRNINYKFANSPGEYFNFMVDGLIGFDFILVDGSYRNKCVESAIKLLKPGGILYIDNSDNIGAGDLSIMQAEKGAIGFAEEKGGQITYFTDFVPGEFFVTQGMLVKLPELE